MREQTIDRLIRTGLKALAVGVAAVAVIYYLDSRDTSPSLVDRQIATGEKAVRANPTNVGLRLRLAETYRAAERPDDALTQYDEVLKVEAHQSTALLGRGEVLAETGDSSGAAKAFKQVIGKERHEEFSAVDPQLEAAYYGLASVLMDEGRAQQAQSAAHKATEIEPGDADAWYLLGKAALASGAAKQAVAALREAVLFVPTEWCEPYEELSKAYRAQHRRPYAEYAGAMVELCKKDPAGASKRLKRLTSGPAAIDAMLGLGMAAEAESNRAEAKRWYRKVVTAEPGNFNARGGLTRLGVSLPTGAASSPAAHLATGGE
jgi:tetratricopeptide (TPR) repeat protein